MGIFPFPTFLFWNRTLYNSKTKIKKIIIKLFEHNLSNKHHDIKDIINVKSNAIDINIFETLLYILLFINNLFIIFVNVNPSSKTHSPCSKFDLFKIIFVWSIK